MRLTQANSPSRFDLGSLGDWNLIVEDPLRAMCQVRQRYYDPAIGRFVSEDPVRQAGGDNLFAYTQNDPVNKLDPSGHESDQDKDAREKQQRQQTMSQEAARTGYLGRADSPDRMSGGGGNTPSVNPADRVPEVPDARGHRTDRPAASKLQKVQDLDLPQGLPETKDPLAPAEWGHGDIYYALAGATTPADSSSTGGSNANGTAEANKPKIDPKTPIAQAKNTPKPWARGVDDVNPKSWGGISREMVKKWGVPWETAVAVRNELAARRRADWLAAQPDIKPAVLNANMRNYNDASSDQEMLDTLGRAAAKAGGSLAGKSADEIGSLAGLPARTPVTQAGAATMSQAAAQVAAHERLAEHQRTHPDRSLENDLNNFFPNVGGRIGEFLSFIQRIDAAAGPMPTYGLPNKSMTWAATDGRKEVIQSGLRHAEEFRQASADLKNQHPMVTTVGQISTAIVGSSPQIAATVAMPEAAPAIWGFTGAADSFNRAKEAGASDATATKEGVAGGVLGTATSLIPGGKNAEALVRTGGATGLQSIGSDLIAKAGHDDPKSTADILKSAGQNTLIGAGGHLVVGEALNQAGKQSNVTVGGVAQGIANTGQRLVDTANILAESQSKTVTVGANGLGDLPDMTKRLAQAWQKSKPEPEPSNAGSTGGVQAKAEGTLDPQAVAKGETQAAMPDAKSGGAVESPTESPVKGTREPMPEGIMSAGAEETANEIGHAVNDPAGLETPSREPTPKPHPAADGVESGTGLPKPKPADPNQDFGKPGETVRRFDSKGAVKDAKKKGIKYDPEKGKGIPTTTTDIVPINPDKIRQMTGARNADHYIVIDIGGKKVVRLNTKTGHMEIRVQEDIRPDDITDSGRTRKSGYGGD